MQRYLVRLALFGLTAVAAISAADAEDVIGQLKAYGKVDIATPVSRFSLNNREYAYFSGDSIHTTGDSQAVVRLREGLDITFARGSKGRVSRKSGIYHIDVRQGRVSVHGKSGVAHRITHNGKSRFSRGRPNPGGRPPGVPPFGELPPCGDVPPFDVPPCDDLPPSS